MLKKTIVLAICFSTLLSGTAYAKGGYFGGNVAFWDYSETGIVDDAAITSVYGRLGTPFNDYFSGELRIGVGIENDTVNVNGTKVDVELDNMFGAYIRGGMPVTESVFPYIIVGYTRGELTTSTAGARDNSESESDVSFGLGTDFIYSENIIINVEYMNYFDKNGSDTNYLDNKGAEIDGFSIGITSKF